MVRMDNVTGRADDLLIVRGVNLYPSEIEDVVLEFEEVAPYYRIDLSREDNLDRMDLTIEREPEFDDDLEELRDQILTRLSNVLSFTPDELTIAEPGEIERTDVGKVKRVYDHR
jgi:phenylacetate-CoA ligase